MYYEVHGQGVPVLLLHGHTLDRRMWNEQVKVLEPEYTVVVPDLRGYGLSSDPAEGYQFTHADDVVTLMDSLQLDQAHIVGLSMGAFVAGDLLAMFPERVLSCVMVGGELVNYTGPSHPRSASEIESARQRIASVQKKGLETYKKERVETLIRIGGSRREEMRANITPQIMEWGAWQALHVTCRVYYGQDAWVKYKAAPTQIPYLIIYGQKEGAARSRMLSVAPWGRQLSFDDCGHMVNLEQPERFNQTLLDWLHEHPYDEPEDNF